MAESAKLSWAETAIIILFLMLTENSDTQAAVTDYKDKPKYKVSARCKELLSYFFNWRLSTSYKLLKFSAVFISRKNYPLMWQINVFHLSRKLTKFF